MGFFSRNFDFRKAKNSFRFILSALWLCLIFFKHKKQGENGKKICLIFLVESKVVILSWRVLHLKFQKQGLILISKKKSSRNSLGSYGWFFSHILKIYVQNLLFSPEMFMFRPWKVKISENCAKKYIPMIGDNFGIGNSLFGT